MNNFLILSLIFISAIVGFLVGCWLDSIRWEKTIRYLLEEMEKKQDEQKV
jgi:hypothetical protein